MKKYTPEMEEYPGLDSSALVSVVFVLLTIDDDDAGANEDVDGDGAADETKWPSEAWNGDGEGSPLDPGCALALNDDDMDRRPRVF